MMHLRISSHLSRQSPVSSLQKTHNRIRETGIGERETKQPAWLMTEDCGLRTC